MFHLYIDSYSGHALCNNLLLFVPPGNMQQFHITKIIYVLNSVVCVEAVKFILVHWKDSQAISAFGIASSSLLIIVFPIAVLWHFAGCGSICPFCKWLQMLHNDNSTVLAGSHPIGQWPVCHGCIIGTVQQFLTCDILTCCLLVSSSLSWNAVRSQLA